MEEEKVKRFHIKSNAKQEYAAKWFQEILNNPNSSDERKDFAAKSLKDIGNTHQIRTLITRLKEAEKRIARLMSRNAELTREVEELKKAEPEAEIPNSLQDLYK